MSMSIVPFDSDKNLPAYLTSGVRRADINNDIAVGAAFPTMSIKGMKFTIARDGVRKVLTKPDDPDEVAQNIGVVIVRANMNSKVFYLKKYAEGDSEGARPDCYSYDGVAPSPNSPNPQAKKCSICPNNVWGSRVGDGDKPADGSEKKGKACSDNARLAISAPDKLEPMLLRVPPASLKALREAAKIMSQRKLDYNMVLMKIGFDRDAPSPKLTFKPVGLLDDGTYQEVNALYDEDTVRSIVGAEDHGVEGVAPEPKPAAVDADELDAALAAREVTQKAKAAPKAPAVSTDELDDMLGGVKEEAPKPAPKAAKAAPKPVAEEPAPTPPPNAEKPAGGASSLLSDLDDLLGNKDD